LRQTDISLLEYIPMSDIVCLRRGELAFDPRTQSLEPLAVEMLKIQGKDRGWECVYFLPKAKSCSIYDHRPLECRSLFCGDTTQVLQAMDEPALAREHVVAKDSGLWSLICDHEGNFPVAEAMSLARTDAGGNAILPDLDELLRREIHFRSALAARVQARDRDLWVYLGRPLWLVLLPLNPLLSRYEEI
jgi:hypothetical protein